MARRHARRAAHQRVGAVAHAAAGFGRRGRVARVVLARPPATGEGTVGAAREPRLPCVCRTKHTIRVRDFGCVPALRHLVECVSVVEHVPHGRDRADVPPRYIRVEGSFVVEQLAHARHQRHVPIGHLDRPRGTAVHPWFGAARHAGGIAVGGIQAAIDRSQEISLVRERRALTNRSVDEITVHAGPRADQGVPGVARRRARRLVRE
mmetsp:Transcript_7271/g.32023  ORF Transcript_7271/g.32023 Transcript_7271/m.32023 type:complete len:207 (+) Transcript_7271:635-1255(+)